MNTTKKPPSHAITPKAEEAVEQLQHPQGQSLQQQLLQAIQPEPGEVKTVTLLRLLLHEQKTTNAILSGITPVLSKLAETLQELPGSVLTIGEELEEIHGLILDHQEYQPQERDMNEDDDTAENSEVDESDEIEEEMQPQQRRALQPSPLTGSYAQSVLKNATWHPGEPRPVILPGGLL